LQGNQADWEEEAAEMSNIYERASFTIAVQHDTKEGFIPHPTPHQVRPNTQHEPAIYVRRIETPGFLNPNGVFFDTPHANPSVIHARAWCYQERMLSPRMLHFMADEVIFESGDRIECQCGNHFGISTDRVMRAGSTDLDWKSIVSRFCQLALTQKWDLLPGVAGIASRYQSVHQPGEYIAGLWQKDLVRWLCWKSVQWHTGRNMRLMCMDCAPLPNRLPPPPSPEYTVPSFSWASRFGPCEFIRSVWNDAEGYVQTATVENVQCEPDARNRFGRVIRCSIRLRGHVEEYHIYSTLGKARIISGHDRDFAYICNSATHNKIRARLAARHPPTDDEWFPLVKEEGTCFWIDAADDIPPDGAKVLALQLFVRTSGSIGLVLQVRVSASGSLTGEYRRIGLCFFDHRFTARTDGSITIT
jgi:hypothetical protein